MMRLIQGLRQAGLRILRRFQRWLARWPLRWRVIVAALGMLAVLLLGLGALVSVVEQSMLQQNTATTLFTQARTVAPTPRGGLNNPNTPPELVYLAPRSGAPPPIGAPVGNTFIGQAGAWVELLSGPTTSATVLSTSGTPLIISDKPYFIGSVTPSASAIHSALTNPPSDRAYTLVTDSVGRSQLMLLLPIVQNYHTVALLQLATSTRQIDDAVTTTRLILFYGIGGCLLLAGLLSWPLLDRALRPLAEMEAGARRIADGDLTVRLNEPESEDEVGHLARTFNVMVAKVEGAFNRQRRFVADVSHELRTPLTALGGGLEMLMMGADQGDTAAARRLMRGMYAETERMRHLVEDLLALARLDEGRAQLHLEGVDPQTALTAAVEQGERIAQGQTLSVDIAPKLPLISADAERLRQVLLILLDNAVKYTPRGGAITLSARLLADESPGASWVALEVRDTGQGISADALPHVFDRFYRADPARARIGERSEDRSSGSGLGLAIAKGLVEAMGGRINIVSEQGNGASVTVEAPIWRGATQPNKAIRPPPAPISALPAPQSSTPDESTPVAAEANETETRRLPA
jgi:signal transduction histidine kinase